MFCRVLWLGWKICLLLLYSPVQYIPDSGFYYFVKYSGFSISMRSIFAYFVLILGVAQYSQGITNLADVACGQQPMKPNPKLKAARIAGGSEAFRGEFPWMVSLQYTGPEQSHFCGGFLINNRYVVSAAHCFQTFSKDRVRVIIGEHEIGVAEDPINAFDVGVEEIISHPEFTTKKKFRHDIALLRLKKEIEWNAYVQPACLPSAKEKVQVGQLTSVAGWGYSTEKTNTVPQEISVTLMAVEIPIVSNAVCQNEYDWTATKEHLCAGVVGGGKGACMGDSGSPLMMKSKTEERLSVVGIHAGGDNCGQQMLPGIYTRVSSYVDWIKLNIRG